MALLRKPETHHSFLLLFGDRVSNSLGSSCLSFPRVWAHAPPHPDESPWFLRPIHLPLCPSPVPSTATSTWVSVRASRGHFLQPEEA